MMLATETALTARPQALPFTAPRRAGRAGVFGRNSTEVRATGKDEKEAIYIGHEKTDYEAKRVGKQGRVILDDPKKYPSRDAIGVGGWAGGEVALKQWAAEYDALVKEGPASPLPPSGSEVLTTATGKKTELKTIGKGDDIVYLGYGKDEDLVRKAGAPGRFVRDDARKYPSKDSIGPIVNIAGGFAGGELGVKKFAKDGTLDPNASGRRQMQSPLVVAGIVALFGTTGALLLNDVTDVTEAVVKSDLAAIDDKTKLLIEAAVGLIGVVAAVAGTRIFVRKTTETITNTAGNVAKLAAFWVALFFAARFVLEN